MIAHINKYGDKQSLKAHLENTAQRAEAFAEEFGCGQLGYMSGLLHDIGKYSAEFQKRIEDPEHHGKVDHSTAGAVEAKKLSPDYIPLAMAIAGHHSGLMDGGSYKFSQQKDGTFWGRMKNRIPEYKDWKEEIVPEAVSLPAFFQEDNSRTFTMSFFIRMIYSCLVDADYLDTECFMNRGKDLRGSYASTETLLLRFEKYIAPWIKRDGVQEEKSIYDYRNRILLSCMEKGKLLERGLYTLTVPTGGGKTTASLGFALNHMKAREMKRVIYVIPYTSVIDQNAAVFAKILGTENVLEHHSGAMYDMPEDERESGRPRSKALAVENWDAPVVVSTAVQFFESLFACRNSRCRKLHNLANSVIIFDEAQTLPIPYLEPCIAAIAQLVKHYRSTAVLCTATQPALESIFQKYISGLKLPELCDGAKEIYGKFRRTFVWHMGHISIETLTQHLMGQEQVLCIVNKRKTAQQLYEELPKEGAFCLTTLLCPVHRKRQFEEIKYRLEHHMDCRVAATSLIEAGVDLDFPRVYRQEAGLDSVLQAAGRCNREGKRAVEESKVCIFSLENDVSKYLVQNIAALDETIRNYEDVSDPDAIAYYFTLYRELLGRENLDQKNILPAWDKGIEGRSFPFASVDKMFKLIENDTKTIYIPVEEGEELIAGLYEKEITKETFRKLGQYGVNIYPQHFEALWQAGCLESLDGVIYILRDMNQYSVETGLRMDVETGCGIWI